jgi:hypothetical protein
MDNHWQNELRNLLNELIIDEMRQNIRGTRGTRRARTAMSQSQEQTQLVTVLRELIYGYNEQMRDYGDNMRTILQIIQTMQNNMYEEVEPPIRVRQTTPTAARTNGPPLRQNTNIRQRQNYEPGRFLSWLIYPLNDLSGNAVHQTNFSSNVVVRPTQEQIQNATTTLEYDSNVITQTRCPITLGDFETGEIVRQIRHCGHTFCETALQNWFGSNVRCPVCRYDIRDYSLPDIIDASLNRPTSPNTPNPPNNRNRNNVNNNLNNLNHIFDGISTNLTNILSNYLDNDFGHTNELSYTFEFPVMYSDLSGNT